MKRALALLMLCVPLIAAQPRGRDYTRSVTVGGIRHDFHVYVPSSYDGRREMPLLLFFHGGGGNARQAEDDVKLRPTAEKHGFILVRPEGYDRTRRDVRTWNAGACCGAAVRARVDHVGAVRAMLDRVEREWRIDRARVFATGHSNGGMMAYRLACELADRITAIAPNGAVLMDKDIAANPPREVFRCTPSRPVPVMHMHGDADTCMPIKGGSSTGFDPSLRPPVADSINRFIAINRASPTPRVSYRRGEVTCVTHEGPAPVVLCTAKGGGHAWPGAEYTGVSRRRCGGKAIHGMDANEAIWRFFTAG